jgi:predicted Rdx family selenoprotein
VADTVITLRVLRKGQRALDLLEEVAASLGRGHLEPDIGGVVHLRMTGRASRAWEQVRDALDATGDDWRQYLYLAPRPPR